MKLLHILFLIALLPATVIAEPQRPKIGLVLEGGGALGFAHVGVLKVLEEERIPVHIITGTSMGSIVGAAYASGRSMKEIDEIISTTDWDALFNETAPRRMVQYREKSGREGELFGDAKIGVKEGSLLVPRAIVQGQYVELSLQRLFSKSAQTQSFDNLPVRFRAVAADIETGESVILDHGSLATAARASMSVPGFFAPVEVDGRLLVDGGITNNFPADVALDMGADTIIGVQFENPLRKRDQLANPLSISAQILDLLLAQTSREGLARLRSHDILIQPNIDAFGATSFKEAPAIVATGEVAARAMLPQLRRLSVSKEEYEAYSRHRTGTDDYRPEIMFVRVEGARAHRVDRIADALDSEIGQPLDREAIDKALSAEFQSGEYEKIHYEVETKEGSQGLVVHADEKTWLKNYLRFGFSLEDDFDGSSLYSVAIDSRFNDLNAWGGYADAQLEIGRNPRIFGELYQPIGMEGAFFIAPDLSIGRQQLTVRQGGDEVARYFRETAVAGLKSGLNMGRFGEFSVGVRRGTGKLERDLGDPTLPEFDYEIGEAVTRFMIDQLDNPDFPTQGYRLAMTGNASREGLGASDKYEQSRLLGAFPFTMGQTTLLLNAEAGFSSDDVPVEQSYGLGGMFDISGYEQGSLTADNYWIGRTILFYRFLKGDSPLFNLGGYYGVTFEYASLHSDAPSLEDHPDINAGSVFIGLDTPLIPVYLALGMSDESERSVYLNVGRLTARRR